MPPEKSAFINVDELMPQASVEQVAAFYGVALPELRRVGAETRTRCFLACGRTSETGDRALAIQTDHPARQWHCHHYSCGGKSGNLISLMDLMKPGASGGGRPRGARFKEIAADLRAIVAGVIPAAHESPTVKVPTQPKPALVNVPLARSDNERARGLVDLDNKFVTDPALMPPAASAYFRRRPFLTNEACRAWRVGFLPRDAGEDKSGGTMRGRVVYGYLSEEAELLTWFGRDPDYERKRLTWEACGKVEREPEKFHLVKGAIYRGLELYGQHRLRDSETVDRLQTLGCIPVVEGPNDVIAFSELGIPAVGLCSNTVTEDQAVKLARLSREVGVSAVALFLDCDEAGEAGVQQALPLLAAHVPVHLGWSTKMFGGKYRGRQPESLSPAEWSELHAHLTSRKMPVGTVSLLHGNESDATR